MQLKVLKKNVKAKNQLVKVLFLSAKKGVLSYNIFIFTIKSHL